MLQVYVIEPYAFTDALVVDKDDQVYRLLSIFISHTWTNGNRAAVMPVLDFGLDKYKTFGSVYNNSFFLVRSSYYYQGRQLGLTTGWRNNSFY